MTHQKVISEIRKYGNKIFHLRILGFKIFMSKFSAFIISISEFSEMGIFIFGPLKNFFSEIVGHHSDTVRISHKSLLKKRNYFK